MRNPLILPALLCSLLLLYHQNSQGKPVAPDEPLTREVDSIVVMKGMRVMQVYYRQQLLKSYSICLGFAPVGHKHFQGDGKTPEGMYRINGKNPNSTCHKNLGISYPNDADRTYARRYGKPTGGDIKIHGLLNGYDNPTDFLAQDWTWGCIAVTNEEIDELYAHVPVGTYINILP